MEFYQQVHLKEKKGTKVGKSQLTEPMKLVKPRNSTDIKITKGMNVGLSYRQVEYLVYTAISLFFAAN